MRNGFKIFDSDGHVVYPMDLWDRFLDKKFQDRVGLKPSPGAYRPVTVDGRYTQHDITIYGNFMSYIDWTYEDMRNKYGADVVDAGFPGDAVAEGMVKDGIDVMVVYGPEYDLWIDGIDPSLQQALAIAYYRWGEEMRETSGGRVHISGPVPLNDITRAVETIKIGYEKYGVRCFWARPNPFNHRTLGSKYYDPMYEVLTELNCAFATHEFMGLNGTSAGSERFRSFTEWHTVVHPMEQQMAMLSMMVHGVFERHPSLRVGYMEGNCSWLPWWLWRMEEQLELAGEKEMPECRKSPFEYFKNNCWITTEPDEPGVYHVIDEMGDDRILWESDYPHPDSKYPYSSEHFLDMPKVSDEAKRKILWDNALDFYQFPESYLPTEFKEATATSKATV